MSRTESELGVRQPQVTEHRQPLKLDYRGVGSRAVSSTVLRQDRDVGLVASSVMKNKAVLFEATMFWAIYSKSNGKSWYQKVGSQVHKTPKV